jgi:hypothetical protein
MEKPIPSQTEPESTESLLARLREEHALIETELESLNRRVYLSAREQMERKRLQKVKLATKDLVLRLERQ